MDLIYGAKYYWSPGVPEIQDHPVKVVGIASNGVPTLGKTYIVELLRPVEGYPYTHATAFEAHLR